MEAPAAETSQPQPIGTSMPDLGGAYSADEMRERTAALLPFAKEDITSRSEGMAANDGNRFVFMRNDSTGTQQGKEKRKQYVNMMRRAGRESSIKILGDMSQDLDALPVVDDLSGYKSFAADDQRRSSYQDRSVAMTQRYLAYLEQNQDTMDALRQSAEGLYGALGTYSADNKAGMAHGKLEAAHRAMNDMLLRSFGGDTVVGRQDLALQASDDKKVAFTGQAMATMQPRVLAAVMDPEKAKQLTPQEQQLAVMYQQFFEWAGMIDPETSQEDARPDEAPSPVAEQPVAESSAPPADGQQAPVAESEDMAALREAAEQYKAEPDPGWKMFLLRKFSAEQRLTIKRLAGEIPPAQENTTPDEQERIAEDPEIQHPETIPEDLAREAGGAHQEVDVAARRLQPPDGEYAARSYEDTTDAYSASNGTIRDTIVLHINGLKTALSDENLGELKNVPELSTAIENLRELVASGKDYTSTREGRQYLLGIYSTAEHAISRYITETMQGYAAAGQANEKYQLQHMPTYNNFTQLLYSIRNEHDRTVDIVAKETRAHPQSDELPVYEGDIVGKDREKKMQAWKFLTGSKHVLWDNDSQKNDQFRRETLGNSAKMLETDVGTELWNMIEASGKNIKFVPHNKPQAAAADEAKADFHEVKEDETGGNYLKMQPDAANIQEIMQAAAYNRKSKKNPNGYDGVELEVDGQVKRYNFGEGSDVDVKSYMSGELGVFGSDIGDNDVAAQTSPWIVFAHEIAHAAKNMLGSKVAVHDGTKPDNMPVASSEKLDDFGHSSEELANWYIENKLREGSETGHKAVYNSYRYYAQGFYKEQDTQMAITTYLKGVHTAYHMAKDYELEQEDGIKGFVDEFEKKAEEHPAMFNTSGDEDTWNSPQGKLIPHKNDEDPRMSREEQISYNVNQFASNSNILLQLKKKQHRMEHLDHLQNPSTSTNMKYFQDQVIGKKIKEKQDRIKAAFQPVDLSGLEPGLFNKRAYARDGEMQRIKAMLETYNRQNTEDISPVQLKYLIGAIDHYIGTNEAARDGKGQHKGRRQAMAQIRGQLQAVLDASRGN